MSQKKTPRHFTTSFDLSQAPKLQQGLIEQGFSLSAPQYTVFAAKKKGVSCTLYQSGKLLVQGSQMQEFIEFYLEPEILHSFAFTHRDALIDKTPRIGIDEAGKGDFFGPLCVAGVFASETHIEKLCELGIQDSKTLNDKKVQTLAKQIKKNCSHHIVRINPKKYNELYTRFYNLNRLLAWGHATAIEALIESTDCQNVIIDQFASEHVVEEALKKKQISCQLKQRHRAEEDIVVAAASILARDAFLEGLSFLSQQHDFALPKGASRHVVETGVRLVRKHGTDILPEISKVHFKTKDDILSQC